MTFKKNFNEKMNLFSNDLSNLKKNLQNYAHTTSNEISELCDSLACDFKKYSVQFHEYLSGSEFEADLDLFINHINTFNDNSMSLINLNKINDKNKRVVAKLKYVKNEVTSLTAKSATLGASIGALMGPQGVPQGAALGSSVAIAGFTVIAGQILYNRISNAEAINLTSLLAE